MLLSELNVQHPDRHSSTLVVSILKLYIYIAVQPLSLCDTHALHTELTSEIDDFQFGARPQCLSHKEGTSSCYSLDVCKGPGSTSMRQVIMCRDS